MIFDITPSNIEQLRRSVVQCFTKKMRIKYIISNIKRILDETLSEGHGKQLLWLLLIIPLIVLLFWSVVALGFHDDSLAWQDLLALFLDPGCFGGAGEHDIFRLIATLVGMFLFSAILISVVSNIFENRSDSYKNGHSRYHHKNHILILGGGHQLISVISALTGDDSPYRNNQIVVLTTRPVDELRTMIFTLPFLTKEKEKELKRRITFYYGERDNEINLKKKKLSKNAEIIYIFGEDNEIDHDSISIRCCRTLQQICCGTGRGSINCYLILQDTASLDVFKYVKDSETTENTDLRVDVIDSNEYISEQVLVADHDGKDEYGFPKIDYREIVKEGKSFKLIPGIREQDDIHVHVVIAGMTDMARAMALTSAHICHFPNFKNGQNRTVITMADVEMKDKMYGFVSSLNNLFKLSHYRYICFNESGLPIVTSFEPDAEYGDFLDIEWEFIDADLSNPGMRTLLEEWISDKKQSLSLAICLANQKDNTFAALHLPDAMYRKGCPIFVHQQDYGDVLKIAGETTQFGNMHTFGMSSNIQDDPLFKHRSDKGKRVNFVYDQLYGYNGIFHDSEDSAWFVRPEAHKFSSIYCANAMHIRERSFGLNRDTDFSTMDNLIYKVEHRRWTMSELILGYKPVKEKDRKDWKARRESADEIIRNAAKSEYKDLKNNMYIHYDITPYDDLIESEKTKDKDIIDQFDYILNNGPIRK